MIPTKKRGGMAQQESNVAAWNRPLGEPGDLTDIIVVVLSLAHEHGFTKVSRPDFYEIFSQLRSKYPTVLPEMVFTRAGEYVYSKTLGNALERALRSGLDTMNPRFFYFGVLKKEDAERNLALIKANTSNEFIDGLRPLAEDFAKLTQLTPVPA